MALDPEQITPVKSKYTASVGHRKYHTLPFAVDRTNLFIGRVELHTDERWDRADSNLMSLSAGEDAASLSGINRLGSGKNSPQCVGVERRFDEALNMAIYTYTFEGIATRHDKKYCEFEMEFTMSQEPIETHPNFVDINNKFGPYDVLNHIWPHFIPTQDSSGGLPGGGQNQGAGINPMLGITSYYLPGLTYRVSYTDVEVNPKLMDLIGAIAVPPKLNVAFPELSDWLSHFKGKRDWLKMAPKIRQRGNCVSVTEEYMLSGYRGWEPSVYSEDSLAGRSL